MPSGTPGTARLVRNPIGMLTRSLLPLDERWHGAAVVARADGQWVGILLVEEGRGRIASLPGP